MTPQEWIKCVPDFDAAGNYTPETLVHEVPFVQEGAQHLAAALEEIAKRNYEITGHRDEIAFLHAKLSDAEEENARLKAQLSQAGRVVVPELVPDGMSTEAFVDGYRFAQSRANSVPASRVLKDGEVAVSGEELEELRTLETCERLRNKVNEGRTGYIGIGGAVACLARLDALRAQGKEKP